VRKGRRRENSTLSKKARCHDDEQPLSAVLRSSSKHQPLATSRAKTEGRRQKSGNILQTTIRKN